MLDATTRNSRKSLRLETLEIRRLLAARSAELIVLKHDNDGNLIYECTEDFCPPFELESTLPEAVNHESFGLINVGTADATKITFQTSGDDWPDAIEVSDCTRNRILAATGCGFEVVLHPPINSPIGSIHMATYTVTYSAGGNISRSLSMDIIGTTRGNEAPHANAGLGYTGHEDNGILFDASSSFDSDGDALTYGWDFGDGATVTTSQSTVEHAYEWGGSFDVQLTVSDDFGGFNTATTIAIVNELNDIPVPNAGGPYRAEPAESLAFDASSSSDFDNVDGNVANDQVLTYHWDFGDGQLATTSATQVNHAYAWEGDYTVSLAVSDGVATSMPIQTTVTVSTFPVGNSNDMYIWEVGMETKSRGKKLDHRVVIDVHRDMDTNGLADLTDIGAGEVAVIVTLFDSNHEFVGSYSGLTDANGVFRSNWITGLTSGQPYVVEVEELSHAVYEWNHLIDLAFADDDEDGLPEYLLNP